MKLEAELDWLRGENGGRLGLRGSSCKLVLRVDIAIEAWRDRVKFIVNVLNRRVKGEGASSSSESLQPSPVVNPMPSRNILLSLCLRFRRSLSRGTAKNDILPMEACLFNSGDGGRRTLLWGERRPARNIR